MQNQIELSRRRLLASAPVVAAVIAPIATTAAPGQDPVFGLIETHLQAMRRSAAANDAAEALAGCDGEGEDSPECIAANTRRYEAWSAEDAALFDFLTTEPTTIAGILAASTMLHRPSIPMVEGLKGSQRRFCSRLPVRRTWNWSRLARNSRQ
jgi:hypothetical protein